MLAERVAATTERGQRRGRGGTPSAEPAGHETDRQEHATYEQADRIHACAPSRSTALDGNAAGSRAVPSAAAGFTGRIRPD